MQSTRILLAVALGLAVAGSAFAQTQGALRWRAGTNPVGLQASVATLPVPCGSYSFGCGDSASVPLYASLHSPRTLSMQVGQERAGMRFGTSPGLNVSLVGKAPLAWDLGVYGRVGTTFGRAGVLPNTLAGTEGGVTYGVGLSWDFSRRASAAVGLDSYDVRGPAGEVRDVRTSLGLQWRY